MKAKSRQAHREGAGTGPKIQSVQRSCGLRQKVLQVGKGEIEAQPALGRLEVGGILRCAGLEPFEVVIGGHFLHAPLRRSRFVRVAGEYQSVYRNDWEQQVLVLYLQRPPVKIYRSDALCTGAVSDTALRLLVRNNFAIARYTSGATLDHDQSPR